MAQTRHRLLKELLKLHLSPPEGIRLDARTFGAVEEEGGGEGDEGVDLERVEAWVEGPQGSVYEGGYFKIRFRFTPDYPSCPPKCRFLTKIFHPNVNPDNGEICVNTLKKDWKPSYGPTHILIVIKCLLIHPNPASALHAEAGRLLLETFDAYASRTRLVTSVHASKRPKEFGPATIPTPIPSTAMSSSLLPSVAENTEIGLLYATAKEKETQILGAAHQGAMKEGLGASGGLQNALRTTTTGGVAKKRGLKRL